MDPSTLQGCGTAASSRLRVLFLTLLVSTIALQSACSRSDFETPVVQGRAGLVQDGASQRLWVLTKQEERREVSVGGGGSRNTPSFRTDTFFHFDVTAFDPQAAKQLWTRRLLSIGDPDAKGLGPSNVIGSDVGASLLGQDGEIVWLLIGATPYALRAADGTVAADADALQRTNPPLRGVLPNDAKFYAFDRGLVVTAADARQYVIRGPELRASPYTPPAPATTPVPLKANGQPEIVPTPPFGDVPARHVTLDGQWLGLYSERESADAANDTWGTRLRYPYTVLNEGKQTRRGFWRANIVTARRFDERFERIAEMRPVPGAPDFLNGRFAKLPNGEARVLDDPLGVLVWHSTRIDSAGTLALTRLDAKLATRWTTVLPIAEPGTFDPFATWWLADTLAVVGEQHVEIDGAHMRVPYLVSIRLRDGAMRTTPLVQAVE